MRNWNAKKTQQWALYIVRFYSTYEELKLRTDVVIGKIYDSFYSTYEELKPFDVTLRTSIFLCVFTVPMRNWNTGSTMNCNGVNFSFYSTYEELKRSYNTGDSNSGNCFYSTYEELKQNIPNFDAEKFFKFLQYLWGIETKKFCMVVTKVKGFYSTYEELKLQPTHLLQTNGLSFYSTYEELKPDSSNIRKTKRFTFLQYLWGIETYAWKMLRSNSSKVFTVPMRNWN